MAPSLTNVFFIITIFLGLIICFFGFRILRFLVAVTGFIIGALLAVTIVFAIIQESILTLTKGSDFLIIIASGIAGGFLFAIILLFLYSAGVFLVGGLFGLILFSAVTAGFNVFIEPFLYVIPALFCGIMALLLQRFMIILMTSAIGAWLSVVGVLYIVSSKFDPLDPEFAYNLGETEVYRLILGWIALFGLGFITQYFIFPKKGANLELQGNEADGDIDR